MFRELKYSFPSEFHFLYVTWESDLINLNGVPEETKSFAFPVSPVFQIRSGNFLINEQTVTENEIVYAIFVI